jgi:hypothetical protein
LIINKRKSLRVLDLFASNIEKYFENSNENFTIEDSEWLKPNLPIRGLGISIYTNNLCISFYELTDRETIILYIGKLEDFDSNKHYPLNLLSETKYKKEQLNNFKNNILNFFTME